MKLFSRYGSRVGAWPVVFFLLSLGAAAGLSVGFIHYAWEVSVNNGFLGRWFK